MNENYLTIKEISEYLHISTKTVYRWIKDRDFPAKQGNTRGKLLFDKDAVERWLDGEV